MLKRKLYLWEKKDANFVWELRRTTTQLSVKATQCGVAKRGKVLNLHNGPGLKWLKVMPKNMLGSNLEVGL